MQGVAQDGRSNCMLGQAWSALAPNLVARFGALHFLKMPPGFHETAADRAAFQQPVRISFRVTAPR